MSSAITRQHELQHRILDAVTPAILLFDKDLRLKYINAAGEVLFSVSARHLVGLTYEELFIGGATSRAEVEQVLESIHPFTHHERYISLYQGKNIVVDLSAIPLLDREQEPELLIELTRVDRLLRISRDESRAEQQKTTREIMRGLAHEIKNPLGGLRGAAQLLERQLDSDELKEYTRVIISEADRLQKLVNRILGPSKLPNLGNVNIHEALEHVRSLVMAEAIHGGIHIQRDYDPSIPDVQADLDMLIQALLNIIRNAVEALSESGNITLRTRVIRKVTIGQKQCDLVACIEIIDNGPGIPEELQERIFFPLVTGRAEGTGLGLAIAQSLIEQHEGVIECQSEPGKTVFSILLPIENE